MQGRLRTTAAALVGSLALMATPVAALAQSTVAAGTTATSGQIKTVYHMTNGLEEASRGLGNIRNHLAADPTAKITVVTNGNGSSSCSRVRRTRTAILTKLSSRT